MATRATPVRRAAPQRAQPERPGPRVIDLPPLSIRADVIPKTFNEDARTVELVFSTGAAVERYDWLRGERYLETLSLDPAHVRIDRLNQGGPLLDSHSAWSVADQLGAVMPGTVVLTKGEARATVRFSKRDAVEPVWQDVRDGIIRSVSVGYRIYKFEETTGKKNALPVRRAVDWEPFEISMVPIPADVGASARGEHPADSNRCHVITRDAAGAEERTMDEDTRSEAIAEPNPLTLTLEERTDPPAEPTERDQGTEAERARVQGIRNACLAARMTRSFEDGLINGGTPLVEAQNRIFDELRRRGGDDRGPGRTPSGGGSAVVVGDDPLIHVRAGIENALLHRVRPKTSADQNGFELDDRGRQFRGMTMLRIAEAYLNQAGVRTTAFSKMKIAGLALGLETRSGMHTTSDFANLLADVANKTLRRAYDEAPQTWMPISRRITLPDFKPVKRLQIGEAPALLQVGEHGEFTFGTIGEGKEQFQLATYGRRFAITRKSLVNDDTDAFSRVPTLFGRAARNLESDTVWNQITANGLMGDGVALFASGHGNLAGSGGAIAVATIGAGRTAMRLQTGVDGVTLLNVYPRFLIVPATKETLADQFVSVNLLASQSSSVNPFAGRLTVIAEPRLDASSTTAWYLAASPDQIDIIEYAYLEGEEGPMVESRVGFEIDGLEVKCREDFAAKVIDYRGLYKDPGA